MKIAFLLHNAYAIRAAVRTTLDLAAALVEHGGHEVEIVSFSRHRANPRFAVDPRITLVPLVDTRADSADAPLGPGEIITDGVDGRLVPVGDAHALATAMLDLIGDEAGRKEMSAAALKSAHRYDPEPSWPATTPSSRTYGPPGALAPGSGSPRARLTGFAGRPVGRVACSRIGVRSRSGPRADTTPGRTRAHSSSGGHAAPAPVGRLGP
ncbi:hypothetical protein ACFVXC_18375 [Streptomyces sp. NPDC058257]|uniref:hypothetical protein n=1 Tax=Streptomyces sp. NPDC058257 TaxID=3346409 RepID=UPI0036E89BB5